jgi:hypothetical protein
LRKEQRTLAEVDGGTSLDEVAKVNKRIHPKTEWNFE